MTPEPTPVLRLNVWSGPRNVSTALMYSFAQRADTRVVDEPLYAHYLRVTGLDHPGRAEVLASQNQDGEAVVREVILGACDRPVLFCKQMAHHLIEVDRAFLGSCVNVLLTRDPIDMLPSLAEAFSQPTLRDTGYAAQLAILAELRRLGQEPPVLVASEVLKNPRSVLSQLCTKLGLPFDEAMLRWSAGPRPEDGVWAPHWYASVHRSTGFAPWQPKRTPFPEHLRPLLEEVLPIYAELSKLAIRVD